MRQLLLTLTFLCASLSLTQAEDKNEFRPRDGWPHVSSLAKAQQGRLRVAYLGGSITAADGWRSLTTVRLREMFSKHEVVEIMAALPGTGSDLGVCRLQHDVLRHRPDLLFVEFAVNDTGTAPAQIERSIEGIVRQTRISNPDTDIFFVYTVSTPGLAILQNGVFPPPAEAMENVAEHYGIPSLHLGLEVARRVSAGSLTFKGDPGQQKSVFATDGVHPTVSGHQLYFEVLDRHLSSLVKARGDRRPLPAPLHRDNWQRSGMLLIADGRTHGEWERVSLEDPNLRGATKTLLPPTWRAAQPGSAIEFVVVGTRLGLLGIASPDNGEFSVTVDDEPPVKGTFFDSYVTPTFCRQRSWTYPKSLPSGSHKVRIELLPSVLDKAGIKKAGNRPIDDPAAYKENRLTLCGLLWVDASAP